MKRKSKIILIILTSIVIVFWFLWEQKTELNKDYNFIFNKKNETESKNFKTKNTTFDVEDINKTHYVSGIIYNYSFNVENKKYNGTDIDYSNAKSDKITIEYIENNPQLNRIKKNHQQKDALSFFKEYFLFKLIFLIICIYVAFKTN